MSKIADIETASQPIGTGALAYLPMSAALVDAAGLVLEANDRFRVSCAADAVSVLPVTAQHIAEQHIADLAPHGADGESLRLALAQLFVQSNPLVLVLLPAPGSRRYVQLDATVTPDATALLVFQDVTDDVRGWQRGHAIEALRRQVWHMTSSDDVSKVLQAVRASLAICAVPYHYCGVNHVVSISPPHVRVFAMEAGEPAWKEEVDSAAELVVRFFQSGKLHYRRDLSSRDEDNESSRLHKHDTIRAVVDVPFSEGTLAVNSLVQDAFDRHDLALLEQMADVLTDGFTRMRDLQTADNQRLRAETLAAAIEAVASAADLDSVFELVCEHAARLTTAGRSALFLFDERTNALRPQAQLGHDHEVYMQLQLAPGEGLSGKVYATGQPMRVAGDALADVSSLKTRKFMEAAAPGESTTGAASVPLRIDGVVVGTLAVGTEGPLFSDEHLTMLERLGQQVSLAIERRRFVEEQQRHRRLAEEAHAAERYAYHLQLARQSVREAAWHMTSSRDLAGVVKAVKNSLRSLRVPYFACTVNVVEPAEAPTAAYFVTEDEARILKPHGDEGSRLILEIWRRGEPAYRTNLRQRDQYGERHGLEHGYESEIQCVLDVPFARGTIAVNSALPEAFSQQDVETIREVGSFLSEGLRRRDDLLRLELRTQELAERERLLTAFQAIAASTLASLDRDTILDGLTAEVLRAGIFRSLMVATVDDEARRVDVVRSLVCARDPSGRSHQGEVSTAHPGMVGLSYDLDDSNITAVTARTGKLAVVVEKSEILDDRIENSYEWGDKVAYFIPVRHADRTVAVLATGSPASEREEMLRRIDAMQPLLLQVASALNHAQLHARLSRELSLRTAINELREHVWAMRRPADLPQVLTAVRAAITAVDVHCLDCGVNLVDEDEGEPTGVQFFTIRSDGSTRQLHVRMTDAEAQVHGVNRVIDFWRGRQPVLRHVADDAEGELVDITNNLGHPVAAVLDTPFAHGTLAVNSDREDAFGAAEIEAVRHIAEVLEEGVHRARDLERLERSEERFRRISEVSGDVLWELAVEDGDVQPVWRSTEASWDFGPGSWSDQVHVDDRAAHSEYWRRAMHGQKSSCDFRVALANGETRWLRAQCNPALNDAGEVCRLFGATTDITETKRVEQALIHSEETYHALFESVSEALFVHDENKGHIIEVNQAAVDLLGYSRTELQQLDISTLSASADITRSTLRQMLLRARDEGLQRLEAPVRSRRGEVFWVEVSLQHVQIAGVWRILALVRNINDRVVARDQRLDLARRVLRGQEEERRRIARELHDGVNQILSAASAQLHMATRTDGADLSGSEELNKAREYLDDSINEVRRISRGLRPSVLDDLGLEPALRNLVRRFVEDHEQHVKLTCDDLGSVSSDVATGVYRIVQEALANIDRHAGARHVRVEVRLSAEGLMAEVHDDGVGFDVGHVMGGIGTGLGLRSLRERAELLGGELRVDSAPGLGTTLHLFVPSDAS